jgi:hypothetical protein
MERGPALNTGGPIGMRFESSVLRIMESQSVRRLALFAKQLVLTEHGDQDLGFPFFTLLTTKHSRRRALSKKKHLS